MPVRVTTLLCRLAVPVALASQPFGALAAPDALAPATTAAPGFAAADAIVRAEMAKQHMPGVSLTILRDGKILHQTGIGLADIEQGLPVRADTAFNIGSLSKQFLAEGIMLLVREGKVALDAPVSRYLPDAPASWSGVRIHHLLSHTSGLIREAPAFDGDRVQSDIALIRSAYSTPLSAAPGARFEYSNLGYFILAEVISRTSGRPWPAFFAERIFRPLGMTATRPTSVVDLVPHRAGGYVWRAGRYENSPSYRALRPSGAFTSTATDLAKWEAALASGALGGAASRARMWTPVRLNNGETVPYGFGWRIESVGGHAEIGHGGSLPGFRSYYARYPEQKLAIIVLTNNGEAEPRDIARAIARQMLAARPAAPRKK
jgi:D-alanyl-D-alanine carboxypeptidase